VPAAAASQAAAAPPVGSLFAAFLGYNPIQALVGEQTLAGLSAADRATLSGQEFFPNLIAEPFHHGLVIVFSMAILMSLIGAVASLLRGGRYVHEDATEVPGTSEVLVGQGNG
jgi:hypothetical protein